MEIDGRMPYQSYRHVRKHWKKYVVGQLVGALLTSYFIRKLRLENILLDLARGSCIMYYSGRGM